VTKHAKGGFIVRALEVILLVNFCDTFVKLF